MLLGGGAVALAVGAMYLIRPERTATKSEDANPLMQQADVRTKAGSPENSQGSNMSA